mmetsp:Transcript_29431/g.49683  ORF Transcript_29431/g.49683 Transcript_29431/m.49683 type:complete len:252 (+) Transcript_29431:764-1519(+)
MATDCGEGRHVFGLIHVTLPREVRHAAVTFRVNGGSTPGAGGTACPAVQIQRASSGWLPFVARSRGSILTGLGAGKHDVQYEARTVNGIHHCHQFVKAALAPVAHRPLHHVRIRYVKKQMVFYLVVKPRLQDLNFIDLMAHSSESRPVQVIPELGSNVHGLCGDVLVLLGPVFEVLLVAGVEVVVVGLDATLGSPWPIQPDTNKDIGYNERALGLQGDVHESLDLVQQLFSGLVDHEGLRQCPLRRHIIAR